MVLNSNDLLYLPKGISVQQITQSILSDPVLVDSGLTKEQVETTIRSFQGDQLATVTFLKKYALRDNEGKILEICLSESKKRWAKTIAGAATDCDTNTFLELYEYFLPAGRQMLALGNPYIERATYSNCYTHSIPEDSIEGIFEAAEAIAKTFSYGGGQGIDIGVLRPGGAKVSNTARYSTGAVSFMELYATVTDIIGQYGRRGALLISIPVNHPDIEEFIKIKRTSNRIESANISVKIDEGFMQALDRGEDYTLSFQTKHQLIQRTVSTRHIWDMLCTSACKHGDPGILFWDTIIDGSPSEIYPELSVVGVNPCGEEVLESDGSCCLGSLLLHKFVKNPFTSEAEFDYDLFAEMIKRAVVHLDTIVTLGADRHPLKNQREKAIQGRRIGLGITGVADMLAALSIQYDSDEAVTYTRKIMYFKCKAEYQTSIDLAKKLGPFPLFRPEHYDQPFLAVLPREITSEGRKHGQRNVALSTISPSGSISIIAQSSGGLEPYYALSYKRAVLLGKERVEYQVEEPGFLRYKAITGKSDTDLFRTAHQIDWKQRIRIQASAQVFIDGAISSTVNLPKGTKPELVSEIYTEAWKAGLKGITVYVDGSKKGVLNTDKKTTKIAPDTVCYKFSAEGGDKFYVHVSYSAGDKSKPYQIFFTNYKATEYDRFVKLTNEIRSLIQEKGVTTKILKEGVSSEKKIEQQADRSKNTLDKLARFISLGLKSGYLDEIISILDKYACIGSLASKLKQILSYKEEELACPECGGKLLAKEGCFLCEVCGYSRCG